ncbi:hypothetical protein HN873_004848 [Arachis hypogaea]
MSAPRFKRYMLSRFYSPPFEALGFPSPVSIPFFLIIVTVFLMHRLVFSCLVSDLIMVIVTFFFQINGSVICLWVWCFGKINFFFGVLLSIIYMMFLLLLD